MGDFDDFWGAFQERFSRAPVWLPGTPMALGDVGVIDRRGYLRIARLSDFGISFEEDSVSVESEYSVTSACATTEDFDAKASGSDPSGALSSAEAGMRVSFSAGGGFVVRAMKVLGSRSRTSCQLRNRSAVSKRRRPSGTGNGSTSRRSSPRSHAS